jgi:hypothetical protein
MFGLSHEVIKWVLIGSLLFTAIVGLAYCSTLNDNNTNSTVVKPPEEHTTPIVTPTETPTEPLQPIVTPPTKVDITTKPSGCMISIDGRTSGISPLYGLKVDPGYHTIEISKDGYITLPESFDIAEGNTKQLFYKLVEEPQVIETPVQEITNTDNGISIETPSTQEEEMSVTTPQQKGSSLTVPLTDVVNKTLPEGKTITIQGKVTYIEGTFNNKRYMLVPVPEGQ